MKKLKILGTWALIFTFSMAHGYSQSKQDTLKLLDFENETVFSSKQTNSSISYQEAISSWDNLKDIHEWIKNNFEYDFSRAQQLSNNSKGKTKTSIYSPEEFWLMKLGICVDLSRFAYESMQQIDSSTEVNYLRIEFEPVELDGNIFINHWLISVKENNQFYFFADSKRPRIIDGPYDSVDEFIRKYEQFRSRKINSYNLLSSYKKTKKKKQIKSRKINSLTFLFKKTWEIIFSNNTSN